MSPALFILSITFYLVSLVAALIASFFEKHISKNVILSLAIIHLVLFIIWLVTANYTSSVADPGFRNYLFLSFCCSGILISGIIIRKKFPLSIKIYFSVFLFSVIIFLVSPSRLLGFISSGSLNAINPERIHLKENYFFVEQDQGRVSGDLTEKRFKLVREMGVFHKTIVRNINFPANTDSISVVEFIEKSNAKFKVYYLKRNTPDSLLMNISLTVNRDSSSVITRKL